MSPLHQSLRITEHHFHSAWKDIVSICILLASTGAIYFGTSAFEPFPSGFAGMYALMAERIAANGFLLPTDVPFYGPGGIPLVYPPLALYIMAITTATFHVAPLDYLRFAPPVFSCAVFVVTYFLTKEITKSRKTALIASLLFALSPSIYWIHGTSGGSVRSIAFLFALLSLFCTYRAFSQSDHRRIVYSYAAAAFLGLTLLTHLAYVLFVVICLFYILIISPSFSRLKIVLIIGIGSLFTASPWLIIILNSYGLTTFFYALGSHGNLDFVYRLTHPLAGGGILWIILFVAYYSPLLVVSCISGSILSLLHRKWQLPFLLIFVSFLMSESERFLLLIGGPLAAIFLVGFMEARSQIQIRGYHLFPLVTRLIVMSLIVWSGYNSAKWISQSRPVISSFTLEMGAWFQENTSNDITYLAITKDEVLAEWLPLFLRRTPAIGHWGAEWNGKYAQQIHLVNQQMRDCYQLQSIDCINNLITNSQVEIDYLILPITNQTFPVIKEIHSHLPWKSVFLNDGYEVWDISLSNDAN